MGIGYIASPPTVGVGGSAFFVIAGRKATVSVMIARQPARFSGIGARLRRRHIDAVHMTFVRGNGKYRQANEDQSG